MEEDDGSDEEMPDDHKRESTALSELVDVDGVRGSSDSASEDLRQLGSAHGVDSDNKMAEAR